MGWLCRAVRDATVRSGCELSTPKIDMIEINTVVEALEVKTSRDGQKRFRCAEGWVSALTSKGTPLFQNLGEARLERAADATRREEAAAAAEKDKERAKYAERAMRVKLMGLIAEKLKKEARERDAFEHANLQRLLAEKRAEEEEERRKQAEREARQKAREALEEAKAAERKRVEELLQGAGIDVVEQVSFVGRLRTIFLAGLRRSPMPPCACRRRGWAIR